MDQLPLFFFLSVVVATTFSFLAVVIWTAQRRKERESYYRAEMLKKIAESPGAGEALEYLRETERMTARRVREGTRLGGLIVFVAGIGVMVFLAAIAPPSDRIFMVGAIPMLVGGALFVYGQFLAPRG